MNRVDPFGLDDETAVVVRMYPLQQQVLQRMKDKLEEAKEKIANPPGDATTIVSPEVANQTTDLIDRTMVALDQALAGTVTGSVPRIWINVTGR